MAHAGGVRYEPAHGVVRARGAACGRGDHHERALPVSVVTLYHAADCGLCERALEVVHRIGAEIDFELEIVDIGGDPDLEARYRVLLPVVEIDGEPAFTYFVDEDALRSRITALG